MAAVEHADAAALGQPVVDPPQVVVGALLLARHAERGDVEAGRVDARQHRADDAVLAAGVDRLEHDEQGPLALGEQPLLQLGDDLQLGGQLGLAPTPCPSRTSRRAVVGEVEAAAGAHHVDHLVAVLGCPRRDATHGRRRVGAMLPTAPFGRTGHTSTRVIFGAAALGGMSQEPRRRHARRRRRAGASTTSTPRRRTARRRIACSRGWRSIATTCSSPPRPASAAATRPAPSSSARCSGWTSTTST